MTAIVFSSIIIGTFVIFNLVIKFTRNKFIKMKCDYISPFVLSPTKGYFTSTEEFTKQQELNQSMVINYGTTIGYIKAYKIKSTLQSPVKGEFVKLLIEDGSFVEKGQRIAIIMDETEFIPKN